MKETVVKRLVAEKTDKSFSGQVQERKLGNMKMKKWRGGNIGHSGV